LSADPTTQVELTVANDNTDVETAFSTFVSAYNTVVKDLSTQEGKTSAGAAEPLYGQSIISQLQSALSLSLTSGAPSGSISNLYQLGISVNNDGTLKLDSAALTSTLNSSYSDVVGFMQNSGSFGQKLSSTLLQQGSASPTGAITLQLNSYTTQETTLNDDVTAQNALIATATASITTELNSANDALQSIPQQLNEVNELYNALTGYTNSSS
jgi:flagellar hook-associated protein 2